MASRAGGNAAVRSQVRTMLVAEEGTMSSNVARRIVAMTAMNGGATVSIRGTVVDGTDGYSVSIYQDRSRIVQGYPTEDDIDVFIANNLDVLADERSESPVYVGTWYHDGVTHIDISVVIIGLQSALGLARDHGQLAIYDIANGSDIEVALG